MIIYKYPLKTNFILQLPSGYKFLKAEVQNKDAQMWVMLDGTKPTKPVSFVIRPTGEEFVSDNLEHLDTFQQGQFVWHLFVVKES